MLEHLDDGDVPRVQEIKVVHLALLRVPFRHCDLGICSVSSVRLRVRLDVAVDEENNNRHVLLSLGERVDDGSRRTQGS